MVIYYKFIKRQKKVEFGVSAQGKNEHGKGKAFHRLSFACRNGNDSKGTFAPNSNIKRSEAATILCRIFYIDRKEFTL